MSWVAGTSLVYTATSDQPLQSTSACSRTVCVAFSCLSGGYSKHRREDVQPLPPNLAADLRTVLADRSANSPVFAMPYASGVVRMLKADLQDAGIPYRDDSGRVLDFHAFRHTFITNLARGGVHPKQAQDLARHSDINLTLSRYSHTVIADRAASLRALPDLMSRPEQERQRATGTDGKSLVPGLVSGLVERRTSKGSPLSLDGTETDPDRNDRNRVNPEESSTSDRSGHRMTPSGIEADRTWRSGRAAEGDGLESFLGPRFQSETAFSIRTPPLEKTC